MYHILQYKLAFIIIIYYIYTVAYKLFREFTEYTSIFEDEKH